MSRNAFIFLGSALLACTPTLDTPGFTVEVEESPPKLVVKRADGRVLADTIGHALEIRDASAEWEMTFGSFKVTEFPGEWRAAKRFVTKDAAAGTFDVHFDDTATQRATLKVSLKSEGHLEAALTGVPANRIRWNFSCGDDDRFLGFGGQAASVDQHGRRVPIWVSEPGIGKNDLDEIPADSEDWFLTGTRNASSYPLPTFLSNRLFAFAADTTRRAIFDLCKADPGTWSVETWDDEVTLRFFDGPEPAKAVERLTAETGRQPLANDLALAPWNDAIYGSAEVRRIAQLLRDERIPSGALWTEDFRGAEDEGDNYRLLEEWDIDRTLYPDAEQVAADLHAQGFRWLAYHNTFLTSGTRVLDEAKAAGVVLKHPNGRDYEFTGVKFTPTYLVDLHHPAARDFVKTRLETLVRAGFDGWMADYAEWMPADAVLADGLDAEEEHNAYTRRYHEVANAALDAHPDRNLATSFARSGTLRTAPYQPVVWAGDQYTDFSVDDGMPTVVTMGLNFGLGGITTYGHDIAGYQNATRPPSTKETFFRWTSLGALSPVMRTHHGTKARLNWWFGKDEETIAHFRRWSRFHARLWPYLKKAAHAAYDTGLPIMRQLALAFPEDPTSWIRHDAYLLGPSLLVAPVLVEGAIGRDVYLPAGEWVSHTTGQRFTGPVTVTVPAPMTEVPVFSATGSIIPMLPDTIDTLMPAEPPLVDLDDVRAQRTLLVFAGTGTTTDLDGTTYAVSGLGGQPTKVTANGTELRGCDVASEGEACVAMETPMRRLELRGSDLKDVKFDAAEGPTTITVRGALRVDAIDYRY